MKLLLGRGRSGGVARLEMQFDNPKERREALSRYVSILNYSTQHNPLADENAPIEPILPPTPYIVSQLVREGAQCHEDTKLWLAAEVQKRVRARKYANDTHETPETAHLRPSQRSGSRFAYAMKRILCADDTGTGKSWTALTVAGAILKQNPCAKILIFTPKNLIIQWKAFAERLLGNTVSIYTLTDSRLRKGKYTEIMSTRRAAVAIVNWESLLSDEDELLSVSNRWSFIIGDEAHALSNRKAKRTLAMGKMLKDHTGHVLLLTGTPIERGPGDMWSLLNLLYPDVFTSYWAFFNYFTALDINKFTGYSTITGVKNKAILEDVIRPFYIRRTLEEIAPEIQEPQLVQEIIELSAEENKIYGMVARGHLDKQHILTRDDTTEVGRLVGARQAAIATQLVSTIKTPSSKLERLTIKIQSAPDAYHLVFCNFRAGCDLIEQTLLEAEIPCDLYYSKRDPEIFRNFAKGKSSKVLIATPDSLGTGADGLQIARYMHFIDVPWSHRLWKQSIARLVRIGAATAAIIYHYIAKGTVDEAVWSLIENKSETFDEVVVTRALLDGKKPI